MRLSNAPTPLTAVLGLLLGATLWGVFWFPLRLLEARGLSGLWLTLLIYAGATCVLALPAWRRRAQIAAHPVAMAVLAAAAGWCNASFILAMLDGTVMRVLLLFYLAPVWTVVLGWWLLGERPGAPALSAFAVAMAGALVMLWEPSLGLPWPRDAADWLALSSGFGFAVSNVAIRSAGGVGVAVKATVSWVGVLLISAVWIALAHTPVPSAASEIFLWAIAIGMLGMVIMTVSVQYGVSRMPVHRSAVILLFELVAGALSAGLLTDERMSAREWAGGALVVAAAWFAARQRTER